MNSTLFRVFIYVLCCILVLMMQRVFRLKLSGPAFGIFTIVIWAIVMLGIIFGEVFFQVTMRK
jgi:hypothetical protein